MLITFFRAIILYIIVLIVMRLMGKREIGELQPFELAISIMIADLATLPTETYKMAMTVFTMGPVVLFYPFVQKYFVSGVTIGAVKG